MGGIGARSQWNKVDCQKILVTIDLKFRSIFSLLHRSKRMFENTGAAAGSKIGSLHRSYKVDYNSMSLKTDLAKKCHRLTFIGVRRAIAFPGRPLMMCRMERQPLHRPEPRIPAAQFCRYLKTEKSHRFDGRSRKRRPSRFSFCGHSTVIRAAGPDSINVRLFGR